MAVGDCLQAYCTAPGSIAREPMLTDEPPPFADPRWDALVGGMAEYPYKRWAPFRPSPLIKNADRYLERPFWPVGEGDPALMEYLVFASHGELMSRNVMTDEAPLRRACQPPA